MKKLNTIILAIGLLLSLQTGLVPDSYAMVIIGEIGSSPNNPFISDPDDEGSFNFTFTVIPNVIYFIDPDIAIGYDYIVESGPNITTVLLPSVTGDDDLYNLWSWNPATSDYANANTTISANIPHSFVAGGIDRFRILGIDPSANLDPSDPTAFVTGLTFASAGDVQMKQTPVTTPVPEPATILLLGTGIAGLAGSRDRRKK